VRDSKFFIHEILNLFSLAKVINMERQGIFVVVLLDFFSKDKLV
jgi:hypothetical protein